MFEAHRHWVAYKVDHDHDFLTTDRLMCVPHPHQRSTWIVRWMVTEPHPLHDEAANIMFSREMMPLWPPRHQTRQARVLAHSCSLAVLFGISFMLCRAILSATAIILEMTTGLSLTYGTGTAFAGGGFFHILWW